MEPLPRPPRSPTSSRGRPLPTQAGLVAGNLVHLLPTTLERWGDVLRHAGRDLSLCTA